MKKFITALTIIIMATQSEAQQTGGQYKEAVNRWFTSKEWSNGFSWQPHSSINVQEFYYQYKMNKKLWDTTFRFLATQDLANLATGDHKLMGDDVVVKVSYGPAKEEKETSWETHQKFLDVQLVAVGKERIGVAEVSKTRITTPYDATKDVANHDGEGRYYDVEPGTFLLFFPKDAHRPGIRVDGNNVRKIVVKIRVAP